MRDISELRRRLRVWYRQHRRALPWRDAAHASDPYRVWVAEIMLQQTQVAVVISYYERFLRLFPTLAALAAAPEEQVLAAWSGLGYYRRARQLHAAARAVVKHHGGELPRTGTALRALPGIGGYTAGAIASIAYGQPLAAVDGNVVRIVSRLAGRHLSLTQTHAQVETWVPRRHPGDFNQALMDLGATICLPRRPACAACPLQACCRTRGALPPRPRVARHKIECHFVWALRGERLFLRQRDADAAQLAGLWELPELRHPPPSQEATPLLTLRHAITNSDITAHVYISNTQGQGCWFALKALPDLALTGLTRKILRRLLP